MNLNNPASRRVQRGEGRFEYSVINIHYIRLELLATLTRRCDPIPYCPYNLSVPIHSWDSAGVDRSGLRGVHQYQGLTNFSVKGIFSLKYGKTKLMVS